MAQAKPLKWSTATVPCTYCQKPTELQTGAELYNRPDLGGKHFWVCKPCGAWVGTRHDGEPLGTLANATTRIARREAHKVFDALWDTTRRWWPEGTTPGMAAPPFSTRWAAYAWLSKQLGLEADRTHIAMFDEGQCAAVVALAADAMKALTATKRKADAAVKRDAKKAAKEDDARRAEVALRVKLDELQDLMK